MAVNLKLKELALFEEQAGIPYVQAVKLLAPVYCKPHRLAKQACKKCAGQICDAHRDEVNECGECKPPPAPSKVFAAIGWVLRRRREPDLTWDDYIDEADLMDAVEEMAKAGNA